MTFPRAHTARVFQVHFLGKGYNKRNPELTEESNYWLLRKPGFTDGSERHEFGNLREVRDGDEFVPAETEDLLWSNQNGTQNILYTSV